MQEDNFSFGKLDWNRPYQLKTSRQFFSEGYRSIRRYQDKDYTPPSTGYDYLDYILLGGLYPQHIIIVAGRPGAGKSWFSQKIQSNLLSEDLNPQSKNFAFLCFEFENTPVSLLLRSIKEDTGREFRDILLNKPTDIQLRNMDESCANMADDRVHFVDSYVSVSEFGSILSYFLEQNKDKKQVFVKIDHTAIMEDITEVMRTVNQYKLKYKNVSFIIVSQLNRDIETRDNPKNHAPLLKDLYASDSIGQYCTVAIAVHNPFRYGIENYMTFGSGRYPELNHFKSENGKSFRTEGLIFHHVLKVRDTDNPTENSMYIDVLPSHRYQYSRSTTTNGGLSFREEEEEENPF